MKNNLHALIVLLIVAFSTVSCKFDRASSGQNQDGLQSSVGNTRALCNSVYYWKTVFSLSNEERQWLTDHKVKRLYVRYFDVGVNPEHPDAAIPNATIIFRDSLPGGIEIVPVVFIDNNVFNLCDMSSSPKRLVKRILTMSETNDVSNVHEIQLDCDWTKTTEKAWFEFLRSVRKELSGHQIMLSATIRLHQLNQQVPPVDRGVLMCYNTGAVRSQKTKNSILDAGDVALYAKKLKSYTLPLDIAYPTFSWAVWFDMKGNFQSLLRALDSKDKNLQHKGSNRYTVKNGFYWEGKYIPAGDEVRFEFSNYDEIMATKKILEPRLKNYSVILYHLDNNNLSKYTPHEIDEIYNN